MGLLIDRWLRQLVLVSCLLFIGSTIFTESITAASGGTSPYSYAVTAGALPGGLTLNASTGAITGTPSALGTFNFSITATDSSTGSGPYSATQNYSLQIEQSAPVANPVSATVALVRPAMETMSPAMPSSISCAMCRACIAA